MDKSLTKLLLDDLLFYTFLWVIIWGRLWYVIFYKLNYYLLNPIDILKVWEWWMSFHWWLIWVIIAIYIFSKKFKLNFYNISDQVTSVLPIWLWLWRIWNYINKELLWFENYYWPFSVDWKFPSPLLEFVLEWVILFLILNYVYKKKQFHWQIASLFLIFYWIFRLFVEIFFRTPDAHIWYLFWYLTIWELLTIPMVLYWILYYFYLKRINYEFK